LFPVTVNGHTCCPSQKERGQDEILHRLSVTVKDEYPLPRINDALDILGEARYFTKLDASVGYWQIPMYPPDRGKTAFTTRFATFQIAMDSLLSGLMGNTAICYVNTAICYVNTAICYVNKILVYSTTFEDHLKTLEEIFRCCEKANLQLRPEK